MKEEQLIQELRDGQDRAFIYLYRENFSNTFHYVTNNSGTSEDAEDIFQEALIVLVKKLREQTFELNVKVSSYLYAVATKMWLYKLRSRKGIYENPDFLENQMDLNISLGDSDNQEAHFAIVEHTMSILKEECRKMLSLFYFERKSMIEISGLLGYSQDFVKVKKSRCMNELRKRLLQHEEFQDLIKI